MPDKNPSGGVIAVATLNIILGLGRILLMPFLAVAKSHATAFTINIDPLTMM